MTSVLTSPQKKAAHDALQLLYAADVSPEAFLGFHARAVNERNVGTSNRHATAVPQRSIALIRASYVPLRATYFSIDQLNDVRSRLTRKTHVSAIVEHPEGAVVEYPETGRILGESVAHIFDVDPDEYNHPRDNIQYSLGGSHGGSERVGCCLLRDPDTGKVLQCRKHTFTCTSTKFCEFSENAITEELSDHTNNFHLPWSAKREVFTKTLALYTALQQRGCAFRDDELAQDLYAGDDDNYASDSSESSSSGGGNCKGKLFIHTAENGRTIIQCSRRMAGHRAHLRLSNLSEYDLVYLRALFNNDDTTIRAMEEEAKKEGYGPLMPCKVMFPSRAKRQFCSEWHRLPNGSLDRGELHRDIVCNATFHIFTPFADDLRRIRKIVIVCTNPHSHPRPAPTKTPPLHLKIFNNLLMKLGWKLADATPRRILLDTGFMSGLRTELGWTDLRDPAVANLHPSLGNLDHVKRIILDLRDKHFPSGTGFEGAKKLKTEHDGLPIDIRYVRFAKEITVDKEKFRIIICMSAKMSFYLINAKRLTMDTSFKRVYGWQEFEIETWHDNGNKSIVVCRSFITSQTAVAHLALFQQIFSIAQRDTGQQVRFRHIHGEGYEMFVMDAHRGQSLGLGLFCQSLCKGDKRACVDEPGCTYEELGPYDHLSRTTRVCSVHYARNIHELGGAVSHEIKELMRSLMTTELLPDFYERLNKIKGGGKKAADWLQDKISSKFVIPGIYWAASKIPLEIWKASPSTTNNNEQAHRNINRDGVSLTLLAGVMKGLQYDLRAFDGLDTTVATGVQIRDKIANRHFREQRSISRQVHTQQRRIDTADEEMRKLQEAVDSTAVQMTNNAGKLHQEAQYGYTDGPAHRKYQKLTDKLDKVKASASELSRRGSGAVSVDFSAVRRPGVATSSSMALAQNVSYGVGETFVADNSKSTSGSKRKRAQSNSQSTGKRRKQEQLELNDLQIEFYNPTSGTFNS